jgi:hypothetical protein
MSWTAKAAVPGDPIAAPVVRSEPHKEKKTPAIGRRPPLRITRFLGQHFEGLWQAVGPGLGFSCAEEHLRVLAAEQPWARRVVLPATRKIKWGQVQTRARQQKKPDSTGIAENELRKRSRRM